MSPILICCTLLPVVLHVSLDAVRYPCLQKCLITVIWPFALHLSSDTSKETLLTGTEEHYEFLLHSIIVHHSSGTILWLSY